LQTGEDEEEDDEEEETEEKGGLVPTKDEPLSSDAAALGSEAALPSR